MPRMDGTGPQGKGPGTGRGRGGCGGRERPGLPVGRTGRPQRPGGGGANPKGRRKLGWRSIFGPGED